MRRTPDRRAFTLIELMIVVAIIGILAAISIPKFADLIRKSNEGATKGNLGGLRSAITIYYGDQEGTYPAGNLSSLTLDGKYISAIPKAKTPPYHADSATVNNNDTMGMGGLIFGDNGGWSYWNNPAMVDPARGLGELWVGCQHTDGRGTLWSEY